MRGLRTGARWSWVGRTPTPEADGLVAAYDRDAAALAQRYETADPAALFAPVADLLPAAGKRVADIGAGTGRDAAWLTWQGHRVVAVEPAAGMRRAAQAFHAGRPIEWIDDRLPDLPRLKGLGERFDLLLLNGVWHHLNAAARVTAMAVLAELLAPGGRVLLRVRHGPAAPERPGFDLPIADTLNAAARDGLVAVASRPVEAMLPINRAAGVTWTWIALARR